MHNRVCTIIRDSTLRSQLRQMLEAVDGVDSVSSFSERFDCLNAVKGGEHFDIFFLEYSVAKTDQSDFIAMIKNQPTTKRAKFLSVVPIGQQNAQSLADHLLLGFNNILCEPYSVASIESIMTLDEDGQYHTGARMALAAKLLVASAMGGFEEENQVPGSSLVTSVRNSCKKFCQDTGVTMSGYFKQLGTKLKRSTPAERISYTGVSDRVRKNFLDRLRGEKR